MSFTAQDNFAIDNPVGVYGGTFDPVHQGHLHAAQTILATLGLDQIKMVLSARPGHRGTPHCSVEDRWRMLERACANIEGLVADDREVVRPGKSFTFLTVREYHAEGLIPCWIVGQDSFATLAEWHRWRELLHYCNFVVIERPGDAVPLPADVMELEERYSVATLDLSRTGQIWRTNIPMLEISATDIRKIIGEGGDASDLLEETVWTYIRQHNLYVEASV